MLLALVSGLALGGCSGGSRPEARLRSAADLVGTWGDPTGQGVDRLRAWYVFDGEQGMRGVAGCNQVFAGASDVDPDGWVELHGFSTTLAGCHGANRLRLVGVELVGYAGDAVVWRLERTSVRPLPESTPR